MSKVHDRWLTLTPAYGRDYPNPTAVLAAWVAGKDFRVADISCPWNGAYISARDGEAADVFDVFKIRFDKLQEFALVRRAGDAWVLEGEADAEPEAVSV